MNDPQRQRLPADHAAFRWSVRGLAMVAFAASVYLGIAAFGHGPIAGCAGGELIDCDHVLSSGFSRLLGVPVGLFGAGVYGLIAALSLMLPRRTTIVGVKSWYLLWLFALMAAGSGLWFTYLQVFDIGKLCMYCLVVHGCGLTIATLVGWQVWRASRASESKRSQADQSLARSGLWKSTALAAVGCLAFVGVQVAKPTASHQVLKIEVPDDALTLDLGAPAANPAAPASSAVTNDDPALPTEQVATATTDQTVEVARSSLPRIDTSVELDTGPRQIKLLRGRLAVTPSESLLIGSPDAPYVVVEMIDYTCSHCHQLHQYLKHAKEKLGDSLAVVVLPLPLDSACNPYVRKNPAITSSACKYAKLAMAIWELDREAFVEYHNWLMEPPEKRPLQEAVARAYEMFDRELLKAAVNGSAVRDRLNNNFKAYNVLRQSAPKGTRLSLPIVLLRDSVVLGTPPSAELLYERLVTGLGVPENL